jgi:hypothetical protein
MVMVTVMVVAWKLCVYFPLWVRKSPPKLCFIVEILKRLTTVLIIENISENPTCYEENLSKCQLSSRNPLPPHMKWPGIEQGPASENMGF